MASRTFRRGRRHGPSITTQISPGWVTLLQPARQASVQGHLSSLRPHWTGHYSRPADRQNLLRFTARLYAGLPNKIWNKSAHHISHRVGRVLSFFSSRRNGDYPNPSPAAECTPPPFPVLGRGAHSLAREGLGESKFLRGDIHCGTLYIQHTL
jgi:hypothetical protein